MRTRTPLAVIGDAVSVNATTVGRRSAVIAVSGGLLVTMGLPAVAAPLVGSDAAGDTATQSASAVTAPAKAQVSFALTSLTTVDAGQYQHDMRVSAGERSAIAERASRANDRFQAAKEARDASRIAQTSDATPDDSDPNVDAGPPEPGDDGSAAPIPSGSVSNASVIDIAKRYTGIKYRFGGTTPAGFDCSGFVRYVYAQLGKDLPRTAAQQASSGTRISASEAKAGDIVSFTGKGGVYHNGIYLGDGKMIDSPRTGKTIGVHDIWSSSVVFTRVA
ncbi:C40 family peptidase [Quadrisphaera granulorum]|uniref:C40 family peptidase n=1 Tax=Quadrisphaera granulorum TaxID=317664 RepID=UPI000D6AC256|nr:C40 family peptidase [Quadrisphaera granulorum]